MNEIERKELKTKASEQLPPSLLLKIIDNYTTIKKPEPVPTGVVHYSNGSVNTFEAIDGFHRVVIMASAYEIKKSNFYDMNSLLDLFIEYANREVIKAFANLVDAYEDFTSIQIESKKNDKVYKKLEDTKNELKILLLSKKEQLSKEYRC